MQQHETVLTKCARKQKRRTSSFTLRNKGIKQLIKSIITYKQDECNVKKNMGCFGSREQGFQTPVGGGFDGDRTTSLQT